MGHGLPTPQVAAAITVHKTLQMLKRYTHLRAEDLARLLGWRHYGGIDFHRLAAELHSYPTFGEKHQPRVKCKIRPPPNSRRISRGRGKAMSTPQAIDVPSCPRSTNFGMD